MSFLLIMVLCFVFLGLAFLWIWKTFRWEDFDSCPVCEFEPEPRPWCPACKGTKQVQYKEEK